MDGIELNSRTKKPLDSDEIIKEVRGIRGNITLLSHKMDITNELLKQLLAVIKESQIIPQLDGASKMNSQMNTVTTQDWFESRTNTQGSGGSTPLQDEPDYEAGSQEDDDFGVPRTPGGDSEGGPQSVEREEAMSDSEQPVTQADDGDDYVSDGGEVEREEVQRDVDDDDDVEREEVEREVDDDQEYQPGSDNEDAQPGSASPPGSPGSASMASPPASPMSDASGPPSPPGSGPQSPAGSPPGSPGSPMSVDGSGSRPGSPLGSGPPSPAGSGPQSPASGPASPTGSGPQSPPSPASSGLSAPQSPSGSGPQSPAGSGPQSPAGSDRASSRGSGPQSLVGSGPQSPAGSGPQSPAGSGPQSPTGSGPQSPAGSGPLSPAGSGPQFPLGSGPASPAGSGPQSPAGSGPQSPAGSPPQSPAGSGPQSPPGSPQSPSSPMFSAPNSPVASPIAPDFQSFLDDGPNTPEAPQPKSPMSDRSRSPSPARSRSGSRSPGRTPSYSPVSPQSNASGPGSPAGSGPASPAGSPPGSPSSPHSPGTGSDKENDAASDVGSGDERPSKPRRIISDDESDKEEAEPEEKNKAKGSDDEDSDKEVEADGLIADIFGSSDEDEEFEGFAEVDVEAHAKKEEKKKSAIKSDDEDNEEAGPATQEVVPDLSEDENEEAVRKDDFVSDFELMMERKKEERQRQRRKRKDMDLINDNDDLIADMIGKMKVAAEEDRELNNKKKAATKKLKLLPWVVSQLRKSDLQVAFLDSGILSGMCEWLAPLPDKSLPHLTIRESLLKILIEFPPISPDSLKMSGIGKAVMYLYKHPRELRHNKEKAGKLINDWSRPIFNLTSNYSSLSRDEREQRDYEQLPKRRKLSLEGNQTPRRDIDNAMEGEKKALRPGDPGWVYRARVPQPSNKDYVVRPKSEIEYIAKKGGVKKDPTRYEKHARAFAERKKNTKAQRAITISIEGRNMAL